MLPLIAAIGWLPPDIEVTPWVFVLCIAAACVITGIAKAGFGGGIGIIAVPLTVTVLPPSQGLGFMLPLLMAGDILSWPHHRRNQAQPYLSWLLAGAVVGVLLATGLLFVLALRTGATTGGNQTLNRVLNILVGGACLLIVAAQVYRMLGFPLPRLPGTRTGGYSTGAVAGFVSTIAHSAGPVVNIYLLERGLNKTYQTGTAVVFFLLLNAIKVPSFVLLTWAGAGYFKPATMLPALWFIPLVFVGTLAGAWMHKRMPEKPFVVVMYLGATFGAAWMIWRGVAG